MHAHDAPTDLQFATSVDTSIRQDVPVPAAPPTLPPGPYGMSGAMDGSGGAPLSGDGGSSQSRMPKLQMFTDSSHPIACLFHCVFKTGALFLYIFCGWFGNVKGANFITVTVGCILLLAADFWVVKNITGRLLVGLRWWNKVEQDGATRWIFESAETTNTNRFDNTVFWGILYGTPVVWGALFVVGFLKFNFGWLITVLMAIALSGANLYGYWKCSSDQKAKFQQMMQQGAQMGAMHALRSGLFGMMASGGTPNASGTGQPPASTYV
mmetsp:Transcript_16268/g.46885  ORF Transcript_16268/g.46885 Transcript_16268/m.46885 type:complete len:267 (-) Transcript_16268:290-1090(-)